MTTSSDLDEPRRIGRFWIFPDGTVLPVVSGGADDGGDGGDDGGGDGGDDAGDGEGGDDAGDDAGEGSGDGEDGDDDKPLGPQGEKALTAEKAKRRAAQAQLREWKALGKSPAEIKALIDAGKGEPDADQIREEARAEVRAEALKERILDKIEAKASKDFADPDDAAALLMRDHDVDDFLDDGKIDVEAIEDALKELLTAKPYLAAQGGSRFKGGADGGARNGSGPKQLSRADLAGMSHREIEQARRDGKLNDLLSGKSA